LWTGDQNIRRKMPRRETRRVIGLLSAAALNVAVFLAFSQAMRSPDVRLVAQQPLAYLLLLNRPRPLPAQRPHPRGAPHAVPLMTPSSPPHEITQPPASEFPVPEVPPATDWNAEGSRAAQTLLTRERFEQQQHSRIGGGAPPSNFDASRGVFDKQRPLFRPGQQPMSSWFDASIDMHSKLPTAMLTLGHCQFALILLVPVFGCALGSLHDPAEEDSFDLHLRSRPLEVPVPLITEPEPALKSLDPPGSTSDQPP
jgi:hypothetical protein